MKKLALIPLLFLILFSATSFSQEQKTEPFIEVRGKSELEVTPDRIYLYIHLREKPESKEKVDINQLEKELRKALSDAGIDLSKLVLADASTSYQAIRRRKKDVVAQKNYRLLVTTANEVGLVFKVCDDLDINQAGIERVDHSEMAQYRKDIRIMAMKAAKEKADYMLEAIGEETGQALEVREDHNYFGQRGARYNTLANVMMETSDGGGGDDYGSLPNLEFKSIKLTSEVYIKFAISERK
ncbi:SIMPL domain-containing protein [bacterium SCSIO 12741]|nr:SIMPL domain-containing protein [bacterium SCSIO 12741]